MLLSACAIGALPPGTAPSAEHNYVAVPETDTIIAPSRPLSEEELYTLNQDAVARAYSLSPDPQALLKFKQIQAQASAMSPQATKQLQAKLNSQTQTNPGYTYLYCYANAWVTKDGKKYPLTAQKGSSAAYASYHVNTWALNTSSWVTPDYVKVAVTYPSGSWLISTDRHLVYYTTESNLALLQDKCRASLNALAMEYLRQNYPREPLAELSIQDITVRGRNNALALDHQFLPFSATVGDNKIHTLVSFGDSLSDTEATSNLMFHIIPNRTTWFAGHFTNGLTWAEYAAQNLGIISYNEAWGGAGVNPQLVFNTIWWAQALSYIAGLYFPSIYQQNQFYTRLVENVAPRNPDETLYTLLIGGNDFINYNEASSMVLNRVAETVAYLINSNHAKNIVLLNLPNLSLAPVFSADKALIKPLVESKTAEYNADLLLLLAKLNQQYPAVKIRLFDSYKVFQQITAFPAIYGFSNSVDPCLVAPDSSYVWYTTMKADCDGYNYVFWDSLHPTTAIHKILGEEFSKFARQNYNF